MDEEQIYTEELSDSLLVKKLNNLENTTNIVIETIEFDESDESFSFDIVIGSNKYCFDIYLEHSEYKYLGEYQWEDLNDSRIVNKFIRGMIDMLIRTKRIKDGYNSKL